MVVWDPKQRGAFPRFDGGDGKHAGPKCHVSSQGGFLLSVFVRPLYYEFRIRLWFCNHF